MIEPGGTIGILGGGQLGRMLAISAAQLGYHVIAFAPEGDAVIAQVCSEYVSADWHDATALKAFADRGLSAYNFITWLAWTWNHNTYEHVPITRSGGYMHVFIGMSGKKPLRHKYSDRDVTGHMRVSRLTKPEQLDTFADALYWKWTFGTIRGVVEVAEEEGWFEGLGESWHKPLKVAMGGFGCYEVKGEIFDPNERNLEVASKTYGWLRPTLVMNWNAFLRGLFSKEEPFTLPSPK